MSEICSYMGKENERSNDKWDSLCVDIFIEYISSRYNSEISNHEYSFIEYDLRALPSPFLDLNFASSCLSACRLTSVFVSFWFNLYLRLLCYPHAIASTPIGLSKQIDSISRHYRIVQNLCLRFYNRDQLSKVTIIIFIWRVAIDIVKLFNIIPLRNAFYIC